MNQLTDSDKLVIETRIYEEHGGCSDCLYNDAEMFRETTLAEVLFEILDTPTWLRKLGLASFDELDDQIDEVTKQLDLYCPECNSKWDDPWIDLGPFGTKIRFEDEVATEAPKKERRKKEPRKKKDFFNRQTESSRIKAEIVSKYFLSWANVLLTKAEKVAYIDFFAGPGVYNDGSKSTPVLILDGILGRAKFEQNIVMLLNDVSKVATDRLEKCVHDHDAFSAMKNKPSIDTSEVQVTSAEDFRGKNLIPTLSFIDPFGFKGLTLDLIQALIKDWGSECIFFFNYQSVNRHLTNKGVEEHMNALFGAERAEQLRAQLREIPPDQSSKRQDLIVNTLLRAIVEETAGKYIVKFEFKSAHKARTSHYIVFVSKNPLGKKIMKEVMAPYGSTIAEGVSSFSFDPKAQCVQMQLWDIPKSSESITYDLSQRYQGRTLQVGELVLDYCAGDNLYTESNCKKALIELESKGQLVANPPRDKRRKRQGQPTMGEKVKVKFPLLDQ